MFAKKKLIIYFSKKRIRVAQVVLGRQTRVEKYVDYDWTRETLPSVFLAIRKQFGDHVRILLSDDFVYTTRLLFTSDEVIDQENVRKKAQDFIPEDLKQTLWDFSEIDGDGVIDGKSVQVVALEKSFFDVLALSVREARFRVQAMEPVSFALNRVLNEKEKAALLVHVGFVKEMVLIHKGLVVAVVETDSIISSSIQLFIDQAKQSYGLTPQRIVFQTTLDVETKLFDSKECVVEKIDLDPLIGLAINEDVKEGDGYVLALHLSGKKRTGKAIESGALRSGRVQENPLEPASKKVQVVSSTAGLDRKKLFFIIGTVIFVLLVGFAGVYIQRFLQKPIPTIPPTISTPTLPVSSEIQEDASESALPEEEKVASISASEIAQYSVEILNGSGRAGEAKKVADYLTGEGFNVIRVGNANVINPGFTIIEAKTGLDKRYLEYLDKGLKTLYSGIEGKESEPEQNSDIIIIIGRQI